MPVFSKDLFPTPLVVIIYLPSSTPDYIFTKIVRLMIEAFQMYQVFEALFCSLAHFVSHLPFMIRYYGLYSNAHRGKMHKAETQLSHLPIIEDDPTYVPSKGWADMIRKVYEIDPLLCPSCGGKMSIISFIDDHRVIDRIICHLELAFETERPPPPRC